MPESYRAYAPAFRRPMTELVRRRTPQGLAREFEVAKNHGAVSRR